MQGERRRRQAKKRDPWWIKKGFRGRREDRHIINDPHFSDLYYICFFFIATTLPISKLFFLKNTETKTKTPQIWSGCGHFFVFEKKRREPH
jgi:hypothetical protein